MEIDKEKVNQSLEQLVRMILTQKKRMDKLEERLELFNRKSGWKV